MRDWNLIGCHKNLSESIRANQSLSELIGLIPIRSDKLILRYTIIHFNTFRYSLIRFDTLGYVTIQFNTLRYTLIHLGVAARCTFASLPDKKEQRKKAIEPHIAHKTFTLY